MAECHWCCVFPLNGSHQLPILWVKFCLSINYSNNSNIVLCGMRAASSFYPENVFNTNSPNGLFSQPQIPIFNKPDQNLTKNTMLWACFTPFLLIRPAMLFCCRSPLTPCSSQLLRNSHKLRFKKIINRKFTPLTPELTSFSETLTNLNLKITKIKIHPFNPIVHHSFSETPTKIIARGMDKVLLNCTE